MLENNYGRNNNHIKKHTTFANLPRVCYDSEIKKTEKKSREPILPEPKLFAINNRIVKDSENKSKSIV